MSTDHNFWRERRAEADSNRGPTAYQPNALPLGQTGSRVAYRRREFNRVRAVWGKDCPKSVSKQLGFLRRQPVRLNQGETRYFYQHTISAEQKRRKKEDIFFKCIHAKIGISSDFFKTGLKWVNTESIEKCYHKLIIFKNTDLFQIVKYTPQRNVLE